MKRGSDEIKTTIGDVWISRLEYQKKVEATIRVSDFNTWTRKTIQIIDKGIEVGFTKVQINRIPSNINNLALDWLLQNKLRLDIISTIRPGVYGGGDYVEKTYYIVPSV